jgi:hypothetical protein
MTKENQQETVTHINNINWLAGIWDGEGSFSIVKQYRKVNKGGPLILSPKVEMVNTNVFLIAEVCRILNNSGIKFYIYKRHREKSNHKECFTVSICRLDSIINFCDIIYPYLISKKYQAELLKRYAISRKERLLISRSNHVNKPSNNDEEYYLCEQVQEKNKLGFTGSSTTLREILMEQDTNKKRYLNSTNNDKV